MGTMIQAHRLDEAGYRGESLAGHCCELKGDNDVLVLTQPDLIRAIHGEYLAAGADMIETNTFNATAIAQADYRLGARARDINLAAARIARECADAWTRRTPDQPRFVAGALGPTNRTASISPDVNDPGARNVRFDELRKRVRRGGGGPGGRRRRSLPGRDDLRHTEWQGRALRARIVVRASRAPLSDHRVRHHHRRFRTHAVRPDDGGVLEFRSSRAAARCRT